MYSDWIDACDEVAKEAAEQEAEDRQFSSYGTRAEGAGPVPAPIEEDVEYP